MAGPIELALQVRLGDLEVAEGHADVLMPHQFLEGRQANSATKHVRGPSMAQAIRYLEQRGLHHPALIKEMGIGYAPGGNLRRHLATLGCHTGMIPTATSLQAPRPPTSPAKAAMPSAAG